MHKKNLSIIHIIYSPGFKSADDVNTNDICFELLSAALIENDSSLKDPVEFPRSPVEAKAQDASI
jgi:hypothetical protein